MSYAPPTHPAMREIDSLNRAFAAGDYTADEYADRLDDTIVRHGGRRVVLAALPNGLQRVGIIGSDGLLIAEYHEITPR